MVKLLGNLVVKLAGREVYKFIDLAKLVDRQNFLIHFDLSIPVSFRWSSSAAMVCPGSPGQPSPSEGLQRHDGEVPRPQPLLGELGGGCGAAGAPRTAPGHREGAGQQQLHL